MWHEDKWEKRERLARGVNEAQERSRQASQALGEVETILGSALVVRPFAGIVEALIDKSVFDKPEPVLPSLAYAREPRDTDPEYQTRYQPRPGLLGRLFSSRKHDEIEDPRRRFQRDHASWENLRARRKKLREDYEAQLACWQADREDFSRQQQERNELIRRTRKQYLSKAPNAVADYCEVVLSYSVYPDWCPQQFDLEYNRHTRILIVEYMLPSIDHVPKLKEVKYVKSKDELMEVFLSESAVNRLYDSLVYQIALRTLQELFNADDDKALDSIVFNGWVKSTDKATGRETNGCIVSVQASREEFLSFNLANVDPKACFRALKGIGSSKLHSLTPIPPILNISREDKRFVSSYAVAGSLEQSTNIAAMDWEDFEHLIRELFEQVFSQYGGEVKITRASRDSGVDAVAFDPDPIRGGKTVIQAKRYTNTVGVAAVRDLYGTVLNEGATKGILVTTADYGPDAYEFAKGKPLTLLSGSNLLQLLEQHGHKATIDLKAAKKILAERERQP